jgi:hypothetical protein
LHGLRFERSIPPKELAATQTSYLQGWTGACLNSVGVFHPILQLFLIDHRIALATSAASVFGLVWKDPNNPTWDQNVLFPLGSIVFKLIMTNASDQKLPIMKGAPIWSAVRISTSLSFRAVDNRLRCQVIAEQSDPAVEADPANRNSQPSTVRLIQMDIAARDDRASIGWIFGTFMYDGTGVHVSIKFHS